MDAAGDVWTACVDFISVYNMETDSIVIIDSTWGLPDINQFSFFKVDRYDRKWASGFRTGVAMIEGSPFEHAEVEEGNRRPDAMHLSTAPNPFNSSCEISWDFGEMKGYDKARLIIQDMMGRQVLLKDDLPKQHEYIWSPDQATPSGTYLVRVRTGFVEKMRKINYVK